ncbi:hypothetical protein BDA99DRAFT_556242 [Phascolomyces articulosus]|uniref:Uncharacterized protein n=1 Tax=Phascolomyces articulosus TaxID=60185 RepID=A0AAD5K771_9FUNG|nr:hypothetical protein BDA99DRAFT_556242 [Phascolomyces articulosus]
MATEPPSHPGNPKWLPKQQWEKTKEPTVIEVPKDITKQDPFDDVVVEGWGDEPEVEPAWNSTNSSDGAYYDVVVITTMQHKK